MAPNKPGGAPNLSAAKAAYVISRVLEGRTLTQSLEQVSLSPSLRGAVRDIAYGSLRYKGTLDAVLAQLLKKPLDDPFAHALLLGALYQLAYTGEAPYAVVDNAVKAAPRHMKALTNAVLRNFLRRREELLQQAQQSVEGRHNFPAWWWRNSGSPIRNNGQAYCCLPAASADDAAGSLTWTTWFPRKMSSLPRLASPTTNC